MLHHIRNYYAHLFQSRDSDLGDVNFKKLGLSNSKKIAVEKDLGSPLNIIELGNILKKMKHNKVPGIDGLTTEFLKVFWSKLKYLIVNALNCCITKRRLSVQSVISCLPKPEKDRSLIKNWRPISLLPVIYKLASGAIAEHIKGTLNDIISNCQTGFY